MYISTYNVTNTILNYIWSTRLLSFNTPLNSMAFHVIQELCQSACTKTNSVTMTCGLSPVLPRVVILGITLQNVSCKLELFVHVTQPLNDDTSVMPTTHKHHPTSQQWPVCDAYNKQTSPNISTNIHLWCLQHTNITQHLNNGTSVMPTTHKHHSTSQQWCACDAYNTRTSLNLSTRTHLWCQQHTNITQPLNNDTSVMPTTHKHHSTSQQWHICDANNTQTSLNLSTMTHLWCLQHTNITQPLNNDTSVMPTTHKHHPTSQQWHVCDAYNTQTSLNLSTMMCLWCLQHTNITQPLNKDTSVMPTTHKHHSTSQQWHICDAYNTQTSLNLSTMTHLWCQQHTNITQPLNNDTSVMPTTHKHHSTSQQWHICDAYNTQTSLNLSTMTHLWCQQHTNITQPLNNDTSVMPTTHKHHSTSQQWHICDAYNTQTSLNLSTMTHLWCQQHTNITQPLNNDTSVMPTTHKHHPTSQQWHVCDANNTQTSLNLSTMTCLWCLQHTNTTQPLNNDTSVMPTTHKHHSTSQQWHICDAYNTQTSPNLSTMTCLWCLQHTNTTQPLNNDTSVMPTTHKHHPTSQQWHICDAYNTQTSLNLSTMTCLWCLQHTNTTQPLNNDTSVMPTTHKHHPTSQQWHVCDANNTQTSLNLSTMTCLWCLQHTNTTQHLNNDTSVMPTTHKHHSTSQQWHICDAYNTQTSRNLSTMTCLWCLQHTNTTQPLNNDTSVMLTTHKHHPTSQQGHICDAYNTQTSRNLSTMTHLWCLQHTNITQPLNKSTSVMPTTHTRTRPHARTHTHTHTHKHHPTSQQWHVCDAYNTQTSPNLSTMTCLWCLQHTNITQPLNNDTSVMPTTHKHHPTSQQWPVCDAYNTQTSPNLSTMTRLWCLQHTNITQPLNNDTSVMPTTRKHHPTSQQWPVCDAYNTQTSPNLSAMTCLWCLQHTNITQPLNNDTSVMRTTHKNITQPLNNDLSVMPTTHKHHPTSQQWPVCDAYNTQTSPNLSTMTCLWCLQHTNITQPLNNDTSVMPTTHKHHSTSQQRHVCDAYNTQTSPNLSTMTCLWCLQHTNITQPLNNDLSVMRTTHKHHPTSQQWPVCDAYNTQTSPNLSTMTCLWCLQHANITQPLNNDLSVMPTTRKHHPTSQQWPVCDAYNTQTSPNLSTMTCLWCLQTANITQPLNNDLSVMPTTHKHHPTSQQWPVCDAYNTQTSPNLSTMTWQCYSPDLVVLRVIPDHASDVGQFIAQVFV